MDHEKAGVTLLRSPETLDHVRQPVPSEPPRRSVKQIEAHRHRRKSLFRRLASESGAVYVIPLGIYLVVAVLLDFKYRTINGDAYSRMANGFYIIYSRDPHLAAIGFVWEPLNSLADMVLLLGNHIWPALAHNDMAGSLTSATAMAGAGYQLHAALREWGLSRVPRLVLTSFFVLNPMILYYGGNGMSEGLYLFTLVAATRYLLRWIHSGDLRSLAYAAIALGFSYLTRNEAFGGIVAGAAGVAIVSYWRVKGERSSRRATALADAAIFAVPGVLAAVGWAVASYVIVGSFFGQLSSKDGISQQETILGRTRFSERAVYVFHAIASLWPLIPLVLVIAVIVAVRRRDARVLAPLTVLGGALGFDVLTLLNANIQQYYRYFIVTIPIGVLLVGGIAASISSTDNAGMRSRESTTLRPTKGRVLRNAGAVLLVLALSGPSVITTAAAMFNPKIGPEEEQELGFIFESHPSANTRAYEQRYPTILSMGSYLASLKLPNGDIVVDDATQCIPEIIVTSGQPRLFVIPNNRDFQRALADPLTFDAHYILEPNPSQFPSSAPNLSYNTLWKTGDGFAKSVHDFPARGTCPEYRLFKVDRHPNQVG